MRIAHFDHRTQNIIPGLLLHHHRIREHATIPADVVEGFCELTFIIAQPEAGVMRHIKLAIRVTDLAVTSCFIM